MGYRLSACPTYLSTFNTSPKSSNQHHHTENFFLLQATSSFLNLIPCEKPGILVDKHRSSNIKLLLPRMRFSSIEIAGFLAVVATIGTPLASVDAFAPSVQERGSISVQNEFVSYRKVRVSLKMSDSGNDNDWFSDYDPSQYDTFNGYDDADLYGGGGGGGGGGGQRSRGGNSRGAGRGGRGGGRGGSGGGHDYVRDTSRDESNVDEATVNRLLSERVDAKRSRDFDTADAIRDQLMSEYSVGVFDRERTWRTGCSPSGSGMGGRRGGPQFGQDRNGRDRRGGRGNDRRPRKDFGPNGHDYSPSEDMGSITSELSEPEIHGLLAERLEAKMSRRFDVADRIQADLISAGVFVHDGLKEWRADGVAFGDIASGGRGPGRTAGSRNDRNRPYAKSIHSESVDGTSDDLITGLVNERLKFKEVRDFEKADAVREGLRSKFNVIVDDRLREWSVGGFFGAEHQAQREIAEAFSQRGYVKSGSSLPVSLEDEAHIQEQVDERYAAKRDRDFDTADRIREALEEQYDLMINDKFKLWSVGGDFGADGGPGKPRGTSYVRRGGGDLSEEEVDRITKLLAERYKAKKERDFDTADDIREELRETYNVAIDDKSLEWHVINDDYVQVVGENGGLPEEQLETVNALIEERKDCKAQRNYERADEIRDELTEEYFILIDDRIKEWRYVPADGGSNYADKKFSDEAKSSQSSAFKRTQEERDLDNELDSFFDDDDKDLDWGEGSSTEEESSQVDTTEVASFDEDITDASEESAEGDTSETAESLAALTVPELKAQLKEAGLPVSGKKAELIDRLLSKA